MVRSPWLGLVLVDPYWLWAPNNLDQALLPQAPLQVSDERPIGGLQLDVEPRRALVYVDGSYRGIVDDFSGYYHHLDLPAGPHGIALVADGYEPLLVDVMVTPGRTTTYRQSLNRSPGH